MIGFTFSAQSGSKDSGHAGFPGGCLSLRMSGVNDTCDCGMMLSRPRMPPV